MGFMRAKRPVPPADLQTGYVGAPIGGINTVDVATKMPPGDALYCWNMVPGELGLRLRLGYQEWATTVSDVSTLVPTLIPFMGSTLSAGRLFAAGPDGIYDVSASADAPTQVIAFSTTSGSAGYGVSTVTTTPGGRFAVYCDEENGLYVYTESTGLWVKIVLGTSVLWGAGLVYFVGDKVANGANTYVCTQAGTSGALPGPVTTGSGIVDGGVKWTSTGTYSATAIGPSLADQRAGFAGDPASFAAVVVWKNRLWLVEKNSTRAWYLGINSIYGVATSFDFGGKMRAGGTLVNLYNWSYDGGSGMDTLLVGISSGGDVVIYQGTDPTSATTFGLKGCWSLGAVPAGRRIATDYGGDILVLSLIGIVPLSKLVTGKTADAETDDSKSVYATGKISNLFNVLASQGQGYLGWAMHIHPTDNTLLVLVPTGVGFPTQQLAMSFATRGWGRYRDLPILSAGVWNGQLYFGTNDGRVCVMRDYVDNVLLADSNSFSPIQWSVLTGYDNLGVASLKKVELLVPELLSQGPNQTLQAQPLYDLNLTEPAPPTGATTSAAANVWDSGKWDAAIWGGDYSAVTPIQGGTGLGRSVAVAARGSATSRTVIAGFHVMYRTGGPI